MEVKDTSRSTALRENLGRHKETIQILMLPLKTIFHLMTQPLLEAKIAHVGFSSSRSFAFSLSDLDARMKQTNRNLLGFFVLFCIRFLWSRGGGACFFLFLFFCWRFRGGVFFWCGRNKKSS